MLSQSFDILLGEISQETQNTLEDIYNDSFIWESNDIIKAGTRIVAPVGTIKTIGTTEYIKTDAGWRYHKRPGQKKQEEEKSPRAAAAPEEKPEKKNAAPEQTIAEGHQIVAPDGTKGKVESTDGKMTTISYIKNGEKKTAQVASQVLEQRKQAGEIQHNASPQTLEDHHKKIASDMNAEGKSASSIVSTLKNSGVDEDEAMKHVVSLKDKKDGKQQSNNDQQSTGAGEGGKEKKKEKGAPDAAHEEIHEDHETSIKYQADNETDHTKFAKETIDLANKDNIKEEGFGLKNIDPPSPKVEEDLDPETKAVNKRFAAFGRNVKGVIDGTSKSTITYGGGGVGKTYSATSELAKAGLRPFETGKHDAGDDNYDYVKITGKVTASDLFKKMQQHNGKILLFDDCDSVLKDPDAINLFKGGLDTSGDGTIEWGSSKAIKDEDGKTMDHRFAFNGKCIFISNLDLRGDGKLAEQVQPIVSRSTTMDLSMTPQQTLKRIGYIAKNPTTGKLTNLKFPGINYSEDDMKDVLAYLDKNKDDKNLELNTRTVGALLGIKKQADKDGVDWTEDADYQALKKAKDIYTGGLFKSIEARRNASYGNGIMPEQRIAKCSNIMKAMSTAKITSGEYVEDKEKPQNYIVKSKVESAFNTLLK